MAPTLSFPSDTFPALPQVCMRVPDTWIPAHPAGATMAMLQPMPAGTFAPNIVVSTTRFGSTHTMAASVKALRTKVESYPEHGWGQESTSATGAVASHSVYVSYLDPAVGTLMQLHRFVLVDHGVVRDLVHAVGMCAAEQVEEVLPTLKASIESLVVKEM